MTIEKHKNPKATDFFCGAGTIRYGLKQSGIQVLAGIDNEIECQKAYGCSLLSLARQIGNELSPEYIRRAGNQIKQIHQNG
jgi:site-specific DNA-cytosine methylase